MPKYEASFTEGEMKMMRDALACFRAWLDTKSVTWATKDKAAKLRARFIAAVGTGMPVPRWDADQSAEIRRLRSELRGVQAANTALRLRVATLEANQSFGFGRAPSGGFDLPEGLSVMDLIQLAHPDRWGDNPAMQAKATKATQWLLEQRKKR